MARLLIASDISDENQAVTRFGGLPSVPRESPIEWPKCLPCGGAMQFLGQLRIPCQDLDSDQLVLLFMCPHNPGCCDEWDPDLGGNLAVIVAIKEVIPMKAPDSDLVCRQTSYGAQVEEIGGGYDQARSAWATSHDGKQRQVLGQLFGQPDWLQGEENPECGLCKQAMRFVAQLEEGPDSDTSMNFGGGCAYVFDCTCDGGKAKLLWQC
jgi:hypothetical protein